MNDISEASVLAVFNSPVQPAKDEMLQNKEQPLDNEANAVLTNILAHKLDNSQALMKSTAMTSSVASIMDDSTPSDSGVQLLDSISSDMNESFMSNLGSDFETANNTILTASSSAAVTVVELGTAETKHTSDQVVLVNSFLPDVVMATATEVINKEHPINIDEVALTKSDIDNSNVDTSYVMDVRPDPDPNGDDIPDEMKTSTCSTFDTDAIVFRRKVKKTRTSSTSSAGGTKKRVSFHEDILKNTRTDNIHIEHGFVTYNGYTKKYPHSVSRYSWCSEGDNFARGKPHYRNACSDVLDYGKTELYEDGDNAFIPYDNSGVFEYAPAPAPPPDTAPKVPNDVNENQQFYQCTCSGSNTSLDSGDSSNGNENPIDNEQKRTNYSQAKSKSCECIGNKNNNNDEVPLMTDNCYFSEPCFGSMDESFEMISPKSVWQKEMKPKSSCLKKTRRETGVIPEYELSTKVKKFNVHQDMNNLFGSLKNIFSMPLPERGVPEGCEDLQTVYECVPEMENGSPVINKTNTKLVQNSDDIVMKTSVDDPMKRKMEMSLDTTPIMEVSKPFGGEPDEKQEATEIVGRTRVTPTPNSFRNKFIVNCESTVFEHTGVFFENKDNVTVEIENNSPSPFLPATPQQMPTAKTSTLFSGVPFKQKLSNIFKSFRDSPSNNVTQQVDQQQQFTAVLQQQLKMHEEQQQIQQLQQQLKEKQKQQQQKYQQYFNVSPMAEKNQNKFVNDTDSMGTTSMTSSMISTFSDKNSMVSSCTMSTSTNTFSGHEELDKTLLKTTTASPQAEMGSPSGKTKHLASPCRRKSLASKFDRAKLSPDLFCAQKNPVNPMVLLNEEFDDLLTITTTESELNESEIEIVDYSQASASAIETSRPQSRTNEPRAETSNHFLRPPSSKSSLINRFLRNVTQKKINDATIKKNNILSAKYRVEPKLFRNLYVKLNKPVDTDIMADFNAEIAAEIEMHSNCSSPVKVKVKDTVKADEQFGIGVGEVPIDIFDRNYLHILRDDKEILMKAFKLYTGYSLEGNMTPVLVFLTDKTLYVADLIRNRLCNKFVLPYSELDVILIGPHGNTVLLSNSARDMQQVLLAGGPYPADGLVSSLELCARRGGATLPAVGQLTLDHLAPLQSFVRENSTVSKNEAWIYYAVVSVPANVISPDQEPLGPNMKGPLMHRNISFSGDQHQPWLAGYFLLKAGVLYLFSDANQKLPSMVISLSDCKGARRATNSPRPHCFEIMLKTGFLQLAAPDEYVASDWLQALVQSASGLFEMQEKHKTLGCTLVITSNHLITLREDFSAPLRRLNSAGVVSPARKPTQEIVSRKLSISTVSDQTFNDTCSNISTPTRLSDLMSSARSSPSRNQSSVSTLQEEKSFSSISSIYGKHSGVEVKTCAPLLEMSSVRISAQGDQWWCILEFSCQEVRENLDDMVIFFATNSDMRRFLSILETMWQTKNDAPFPINVLPEDDLLGQYCGNLFSDTNKSWQPLLSAALGYPQ